MLEQEYELLYTSFNGTQVWRHWLHTGGELAANTIIACKLADLLNRTIYLLPASGKKGTHSADAKVGTEVWEFKSNYKATSTSIDTAIREAHRQAPNVLIHLTALMNVAVLKNALFNRVRKCERILKVSILSDFYEQPLYTFSKEEILNQSFRGVIKGKGSLT